MRADDDLRAAWRALSRQLGPIQFVHRWSNDGRPPLPELERMTAKQLRREQGRAVYGECRRKP
jgi:hypothetical protein